MSEPLFIDVISGGRLGMLASMLRGCLAMAEPFYLTATEIRNRLYDTGWLRVHRVGVPVISIGNLTTGGTGKTPTVSWIVNWLGRQGCRPAIVSRGYRSLNGDENDEKLLLDRLCPDVPHVQNRDRVLAAADVHRVSSCGAIVLDDGFQHRRIHRDLDVVLIDALNPWGFGRLLPRGLLRERLAGLRRADAVLLTRCNLVTETQLDAIRDVIARYSDTPAFVTEFRPTRLVSAENETLDLPRAQNHRAFAFCGIGNPAGFRRTLAAIGIPVPDDRFGGFPDHHHYTDADLESLAKLAQQSHAEYLLTTRKDLVKIDRNRLGSIPVWALDIELAWPVSEGDSPRAFEELVLQTLKQANS